MASSAMESGGEAAPRVTARKNGETEMSVLKYKLNTLGHKTSLRETSLSDIRTEHSVLYDHGVSHQVSRGFTRQYLSRATGKLTSLINKPRLRSVDAVHGEQVETTPDEFRMHAIAKMTRHEREREIMQARPVRVGWREKLTHAQVQRGLEERKAVEGRKRQSHQSSEANRAAMKRRGRDSDEDVFDEPAATTNLEEARSTKPPPFVVAAAAAPSDFFLVTEQPESTTKVAVTEQAQRVKDLLDTHTPGSTPAKVAPAPPTPVTTHKRAHTRFLSLNGATNVLLERERERGMRRHAHTEYGVSSADLHGGVGGGDLETLDETPPPRRTLRGSASAPALSLVAGRVVPAHDRWKHANGLHPTDMSSSAAATLKMIPKLPVHQGLAAEDLRFTIEGGPQPTLFVDTHTALEIACAHVHFANFKARHKQAHYLLLSPDANYLCLVTFWWCFCTYFQSTATEPETPHILQALLVNLGRKYQEYVRYLKIHLALRPSQRLNSWYDQFGANAKATPTATTSTPNAGGAGDQLSDRSGASVDPDDAVALAASAAAAAASETAPFDPFNCVPVYPPELFSDAMDRELAPKTRSGVHHQKERFLLLLPYVLAAACYELLLAFFPESNHLLPRAFRSRLERDLHRVFGGVELSDITLVAQRAKLMRESEARTQVSGPAGALHGVVATTDDAKEERPTFENLFAFNSQVNSMATRPGAKFHQAILNPNHSSVPGSTWIVASAKRLAAAQQAAGPSHVPATPLTRHTRIGGVIGDGASAVAAGLDGVDGGAGRSSSTTASPEKVTPPVTFSAASFLSPSPAGSSGAGTGDTSGRTSGRRGHARTGSYQPVITSERAFSFGASAAAAGAAQLADRIAAFTPHSSRVPAFSPLAGSGPSVVVVGSTPAVAVGGGGVGAATSSSPAVDPVLSARASLDAKLRRRARERPMKGALHSTGDWSRDERERRDFLARMQARHEAEERALRKERERGELRAHRIDDLNATTTSVAAATDHTTEDDADTARLPSDVDDTGSDAEEASGGDAYDPISSAFRSVMHRRLDEVATSVQLSPQRSPTRITRPPPQVESPPTPQPATVLAHSLGKSSSTPVLASAAHSRVGSSFSVLGGGGGVSGAPPRPRPAALTIPSHGGGALSAAPSVGSPFEPSSAVPRGSQGRGARVGAVGGAAPTISLAPESAGGFTASDLSLPLQGMLLSEEHLRHAQQLRPPQVRLRLNGLSPAASVSLGLKAATSAWGQGIVLKHANPIPTEQLGEDLHDGFAYVPRRSALAMNTIAYTANAEAQESQARLLDAYKNLHALQLQDHQLKGAHAGANLEYGDISRGAPAKFVTPHATTPSHASHSTPNTTSTSAAPHPISPSPPTRSITFATPESAHSTHGGASTATSSVAASSKRSPGSSSLVTKKLPRSKSAKLDALLHDTNQVHWTSAADDPNIFLTPRTKQILAQVETNAAQHEQERKAREAAAAEAEANEP